MKLTGFSVPPDRKASWLKSATAVALGCCMVLSLRLWISTRLFPLTPVSEYLPPIPFPLDYIWFISLLVLLLAISVTAQARKLVLIFVCLAAALSLWDQTRWQPWFFQCLFILAALALGGWKKLEPANNHVALDACRLILVSSYFWSGLQKLNVNFVKETWPEITSFLPHSSQSILRALPPFIILVIPVSEIAIALGLLTRRFRNGAVLLAVCVHLAILILLVASTENTVVWPWNLGMILFVFILFWQDNQSSGKILFRKNLFHALILLLFGALPALSFAGIWDSYVSSALYSGNTHQAVIHVSPSVIGRLPAAIHPHIWQETKPYFLDINRWAYAELNVPVYPESRVYRRVTQQICRYTDDTSEIRLRIKGRPHPFTGLRESEYFDCDHLR